MNNRMSERQAEPACKTFSAIVDKRSRKNMIAYLREHFRYNTANYWNQSTSYACNMKITQLGLPPEVADSLFDLIVVPEFYQAFEPLIQKFGQRHQYCWQAGWNGRSSGYLVLYQGGQRLSQYRSYCTVCGQKNTTSVAENSCRCGVCGRETRKDYDKPPVELFVYPGRGTDMDDDFEEWSFFELRRRVDLIQDFDQLADDIVSAALRMTRSFTVIERAVYQPVTQKCLAVKEVF